MYEIFVQKSDSSIDEPRRAHLQLKCQEMILKVLKDMTDSLKPDSPNSLIIRFLKNRLSVIDNELGAVELARDCFEKPCHFWMAKNLLASCKSDPTKDNEVGKTWPLFMIAVLEKSIEKIVTPAKGKEWKNDCLETEMKAIFDKSTCPVGEFVPSYEEAIELGKRCKFLNDDDKVRLIDCLSYYDNLRFKSNKLKRMSKWKRKKFLICDKSLSNDCQSLMELGSACLEMLEVKNKVFERSGGAADASLLQKMSFYSTKGIKSYQSVLDNDKFKINDKIRVEALFGIAQLNNKSFSPNQAEQREFALSAIDYYTKLMDLCKNDENLKNECKNMYEKSLSTQDLLRRQTRMMEN